ncbi:MAG: M20 family metallopeptidase [Saprospiraceae bacterium]
MRQTLLNQIRLEADKNVSFLRDTRHHLHEYPELSFEETKTSAFIKTFLDNEKIAYSTKYSETGIVAWIKGKSSKFVALRADMDALPIQEQTTIDFASKHDGIMHACGHDVHMTCAMGALKILKELQDNLPFSVVCYFQPGEEKLPGGAKLLIEAGAIDAFDSQFMVGQHVSPELQTGTIGMKPGIFMASADEIYIEISGKGGHAAAPHLGDDVVAALSYCIVQLQSVVSRHSNPILPTVLSFGDVQSSGGATNVFPKSIKASGTLRTFDEQWRSEAHNLIVDIARNSAQSLGCKVVVDIKKGYPYLKNDEKLTTNLTSHFADYIGRDNIVDLNIRMTAEDFAYYSHKLPTCFYRLGTGNSEKNTTHGVHTPLFNIDEDALAIGAGLMAWSTFLNNEL